MRSHLPRIHPGRKLTEAQWEELRVEVETDAERTVRDLCGRRGVSVQRFYKRFPKGQRREPLAPKPIDGGEAAP